jgi:hypothetical protein
MNAGKVEPSIVGNGLRTRSTPGPAPFGILRSNPAETNFAFGRLRSKWIVTYDPIPHCYLPLETMPRR